METVYSEGLGRTITYLDVHLEQWRDQELCTSSLKASIRMPKDGIFPIGLAAVDYITCQGQVRRLH